MKAIIVNRVSSKKQDPILQRKDCLSFAKKKGYEVLEVLEEVASAGKSKQKAIFEAEVKAKENGADIIVWKYDRAFRNKKDFADFMLKMYELHNIKVYSVQEEWVNMLWEISESFDFDKIPYPYNEAMREQLKANWKLMVKIIGKMAEDEIKDKGARVRNAIRKNKGITKSYKGNKWGRKKLISKKVVDEVLRLRNEMRMSVRQISESVFYTDQNRHRKQLSRSAVHKILKEYDSKHHSQTEPSFNSRISRGNDGK